MTEQDVEMFNDSLERCKSTSGFLGRFYELFLASSEEVEIEFEEDRVRDAQARVRSTRFAQAETG